MCVTESQRARLVERHVQSQALLIFGTQHRQRRHHGTFIDVDELERCRQLAIGQLIATGIQPLAQGFGTQVKQALGIHVQVADNQGVLVARMPGQGQHHPDIVARGRKASGDMYDRLQQSNLIHHLLFTAQLKQPVV
ncbi:hypothetical protein D3C84_749510 [compost metagenome]